MKRSLLVVLVCTLVVVLWTVQSGPTTVSAQSTLSWLQWAQNPQHTGTINVAGQSINRKLADIVYDPLVPQEQDFGGGTLLAHYQVPILDGQDVFMEFKTGSFDRNAADPFSSEIWHEKRLHWQGGQLVEKWDYQTDWKSLPAGYVGGWEPVFHAVLANDLVYVPGFGGTIVQLNRGAGKVLAHINPFGLAIDPNTFTASPLSADNNGNIYYNVIKIDPTQPDPSTGLRRPWAVG
jgi:hypothetical protein